MLFDRFPYPDAKSARFADVTPKERRSPDWVAEHSRSLAQMVLPSSALRAAPLPKDFPPPPDFGITADTSPHHREPPPARPNPSRPPVRRPSAPVRRRSSIPPPSLSVGHDAPPPSMVPSAPAEPTVDPALIAALEASIAAFQDAAEQLGNTRERILADSEQELLRLAIAIARRVVGQELKQNLSVARSLVKEGLSALGEHDRVSVRLGPGLAEAADLVGASLDGRNPRHEVVVDPELDPMACFVSTELGQVDESVESRMETLLEHLIQAPSEPAR